MNVVELIIKKSEGNELTKAEIKFVVEGFVKGIVKDYQMSSLLMAIKLNGMTEEETFAYTEALMNSGEVYNAEGDDLFDKHSTGGVGDKVSIALLPVLGAMGLRSLKLSGRGLGFTGGTVDKLESIPGFNVELSKEQGLDIVNNKSGLAITNTSDEIVPADKVIYALRDVTGTVDSMPLIAASIMSKKIASGSRYIFIDMKTGSGAFMPTIELATELGEIMQKIGKHFGREVFIGITSMEQPLGNAIGNSIEIMEAIDIIKGQGPKDADALIKKVAGEIYSHAKGTSLEEGIAKAGEVMNDGTALEAFKAWIADQGGDVDYILSDSYPETRIATEIKSPVSGYITFPDVKAFGYSAIEVKAGRKTKADDLDYHSGIILNKKHGDKVEAGELLATVYSKDSISKELENKIINDFTISDSKPEEDKIVVKEIRW